MWLFKCCTRFPSSCIFRYSSKEQVRNALALGAGLKPKGGSRTGRALWLAGNTLFRDSSANSNPKTLVVITDGSSVDDISAPVRRLKSKRVRIFSVGVGKYFNINQLNFMASRPPQDHVFVGQFDKLKYLRNFLVRTVCVGMDSSTQGR